MTTADFIHMYGLRFAGQLMQHNFYTYHVISRVLEANPKVKSIIELGTGHGALTLYLKLWAARLGVEIHTFDVHNWIKQEGVDKMFERLGIHVHIESVFNEQVIQKIKDIINGEPTYIVCDNGNKPKEFALYAPLLPSGSVISAHDWGKNGEIRPQDVEEVVLKQGLVPFEPEEGIKFDTAFGTWMKP